jgi:flagellar hook-associated protein 3 FlgL
MMVANYNRNQNEAQVRMDRFQTQLATQRKIVRLSDDPVNIIKALNARSRLYDVEQFRKNIEDGKAWLTQTESALTELNDIIKRAYELAVQGANDTYTDDDRTAISNEIRELRDQIGTLASTTLGDKYVFGGYNVSSSPFRFDPDAASFTLDGDNMVEVDNTGVAQYNYDDYWVDMDEDIDLDDDRLQHIAYEINFGQDFDIAISGLALLGYGQYTADDLTPEDEGRSRNAYTTFNEFYVVLNALSDLNLDSDSEILHKNIQPFIRRMQDLQKHTLAQLAEVGGRMARMDLMLDRYSKDEINYTQMQSDVEDLDQAEALMWFSMAEAVYRASLGVGGRVLPPSLMDFMR